MMEESRTELKEADKHQAVRERIQTGEICQFTVWKFGFKVRFPASSFLPKSRPPLARLCVQHTRAGWEPGHWVHLLSMWSPLTTTTPAPKPEISLLTPVFEVKQPDGAGHIFK